MSTADSFDDAQRGRSGTNVSLPDPTAATTSLLLREIGSLKELTDQRVSSVEKAISVAHDDLVRFPTEVQKSVAALRELIEAKLETHQEKFQGIEKQFKERDTRIEQTAKDAKTAIDAALLAAEKAVGKQQEANDKATQKSDLSFTKQIDQQGALMQSIKSELDSRITDVKDRFTAFQATTQGRSEEKVDRRGDTSLWTAIAGLVLALLAFGAGTFISK